MKRYVAATAALAVSATVVAVVFAVRSPNDAHSAGPVPAPAVETVANQPEKTPRPEQREPKPAVSEREPDPSLADSVAPIIVEMPADVHSVWYPFNRAELDRLQAAFDEGHQPWRADPVSVAAAYLRDRFDVEPVMGAYRPLDRFSGEVPYRAKPRPSECGCANHVPPESEYLQGFVLVRRLAPGSVFFVVGQRSERMDVTAGRFGLTLTLTIRAKVAGEVAAVAGPLQSEATAHDSTRLEAGEEATLILKLGTSSSPLLVRIIHSGQDPVASVVEFRLERAS
jgi:hypothetical protein